MNKKINILIAIGGTGGHVFPGLNLAKHLSDNNYEIQIVTDRRGSKYLDSQENLKISKLPSSPIIYKNLFTVFFSAIYVFFSILYSIVYLIFRRPNIIIGMGGYASFPICIAAIILRIKFIIYENNLIIGKANKYLMPFANMMIVSNKSLEGVPINQSKKIIEVGNIIKKEIIDFSKKNERIDKEKLNILVLGGSQAAKIFAESLPKIFLKCSEQGFKLKIFQHCLPNQNNELSLFYNNSNIEFETFNFSNNLNHYFSTADLAITRAGSSMLAELTNANIPFISVPLPSSADKHQLKNAYYYKRKNYSFLIEEKDLNDKLSSLIADIYKNNSILNKIVQNQRQHSDKNVYNNIDKILKEIIDENN